MTKRLFIVLSFCWTFSHAQRTELFAFGALNSSLLKVSNSSYANPDPYRLYSASGGILGGVGSRNVLVETGLLYSKQGAWSQYEKLKIHYFDVPFLLVIAPENLRIFIGPQLSILKNAKSGSATISGAFKPRNTSIRFGGGYEHKRLLVQLHIVKGLTDIFLGEDVVKINSYQLSVGYMLHSNSMGTVRNSGTKKKENEIVPSHRVID